MTTAVDDQKKNAAKVLKVFGSFRGCFQQWSNLVSVRRRSIGWNYDLEKNDPPGIPDLGLRDRLASLGAKLLPDLNGFMGEPAISQGALVEIVSLCESARDNALLISPQPGKYLGPAFEVLEADLRSLSGSAETAIASQDDPTMEGDNDKPVLTIHLTDMTATFKGKQYQFDQSQQWTALQKMARWPASPVKMTAVQATRLRQMLSSIGVPNLKKVIHKAGEDRYAMRTSDFRVEIEPPPSPEN